MKSENEMRSAKKEDAPISDRQRVTAKAMCDYITRNDKLSKPQSGQLGLWGTGSKGERDYTDTKQWCEDHPKAYDFMVSHAMRLYRNNGWVSANYLVNMARNELGVSIKNGFAPALARIIEEDYPSLEGAFQKHEAKVDGFVS